MNSLKSKALFWPTSQWWWRTQTGYGSRTVWLSDKPCDVRAYHPPSPRDVITALTVCILGNIGTLQILFLTVCVCVCGARGSSSLEESVVVSL